MKNETKRETQKDTTVKVNIAKREKILINHRSLREGDKIFFFSTLCSHIMWMPFKVNCYLFYKFLLFKRDNIECSSSAAQYIEQRCWFYMFIAVILSLCCFSLVIESHGVRLIA